ncbi:transcriptional regulator [Humibacillus xanthopallidus]|nr:transcriptional regulator [Humibacillus xanthopallidus]
MGAPVIATWNPRDAGCLQRALRLTNEAFAETLGAAPRTVAKWNANASMSLTMEMQAALDTLLSRSPQDAQQRFAELRSPATARVIHGPDDVSDRLSAARHLHTSLTFLDELSGAVPGTAFAAVANPSSGTMGRGIPPPAVHVLVDRGSVARLLSSYYASSDGQAAQLEIVTARERLGTTLVAPARQVAALGGSHSYAAAFTYIQRAEPAMPAGTPELLAAAHQRLQRCLVGGTRFSDQATYRLVDAHLGPDGIRAGFSPSSFAKYGLTWDLLEGEALDAVASGNYALPLRDQLLPTLSSVLEPAGRLCFGGAVALSAFARPAAAGREPDYVLLVQERSPRVINANGRLAVIPKCFHQPTNEPRAEVDIATTIRRELEEELFGRQEVDSSAGSHAVADLLHPSRMTKPMRWLLAESALDVQLTGFAYNLLTGSFEFPALVAVHDERFWTRFGGRVAANWESSGLMRFSSLDTEGLEHLIHDPRWSDEGLVALALGLKRLALISPERVRLPAFEIGATS